jgi:hypothetical protein
MSNTLHFEKDIHIQIRGTPADPKIDIKATGHYHDPDGATPELEKTREVEKESVLPYDPDMKLSALNTAIVSALKTECGDQS